MKGPNGMECFLPAPARQKRPGEQPAQQEAGEAAPDQQAPAEPGQQRAQARRQLDVQASGTAAARDAISAGFTG